MSFTFMRNSKGPRMDPFDTSHVVLEGSNNSFLSIAYAIDLKSMI